MQTGSGVDRQGQYKYGISCIHRTRRLVDVFCLMATYSQSKPRCGRYSSYSFCYFAHSCSHCFLFQLLAHVCLLLCTPNFTLILKLILNFGGILFCCFYSFAPRSRQYHENVSPDFFQKLLVLYIISSPLAC
ncbi:hypothetical protein L873DRAFT_521049 [Choiromyces venosus 120613-1]|uniref:Uncharacterized protein n=1 Tax=Choiromyces venosus 120613-1 TaxID=1336337 RepID=A0A3N4K4W0_9PEZI|nr:hypothetical protein L873DRAFT_521049 [Choiromyces venosus 120613-1]